MFFRKIVKDTIVQNDTTVLISNMRASIQATNVVLNLAIVPNVILMPSNFVILDKKIEGYNNVLTTATEEMSFGVNKDVNYSKPKPKNKPDDHINNYLHNNANNGSGSSSNDDDNDSSGGNIFFRKGESKYSTSNVKLPIIFFWSIAVGVFTSKKIFS